MAWRLPEAIVTPLAQSRRCGVCAEPARLQGVPQGASDRRRRVMLRRSLAQRAEVLRL
jgi:hypothetical protein